MKKITLLLVVASILTASCTKRPLFVETLPFGLLSTGEEANLYRLHGENGAFVDITDYGCRIVRIVVPDKEGRLDDVVAGYGDIASFENGSERFFGSVIGRYGNRINRAGFELDGKHVSLTHNETLDGEPVHLHGGEMGFDRVLWQGEAIEEEGRVGLCLTRLSPDGEEGYPGNLYCSVTYWWDASNTLRVEYRTETDKPTIVNLSNHTYFNLKGSGGGYVMDHQLQVSASKYFVNNKQFVPSGPSVSVEGTPFDMRTPHRVDYAIDTPNEQIRTMHGFSVCWELDDWIGELHRVAELFEPRTGRGIELWTTEPGLLTYTGRSFNEDVIGKYGPIEKFGGMLLETLHFPDSPNHPELPTTVLRPGEHYLSITEFKFFTR